MDSYKLFFGVFCIGSIKKDANTRLCECVFLFVVSESEGERSQETVLEKRKERTKER